MSGSQVGEVIETLLRRIAQLEDRVGQLAALPVSDVQLRAAGTQVLTLVASASGTAALTSAIPNVTAPFGAAVVHAGTAPATTGGTTVILAMTGAGTAVLRPGTALALSDVTPAALGAAGAVGTAIVAARGDHVHIVPSASDITGGTLADARLSSNVPLKNAANTFTAAQQIGQSGDTGTMLTVYTQTVLILNTNTDSTSQFTLQNDARMYSFALSGAAGDAFLIYDNTAGATRLLIDANGVLYLYALRTSPATPASGEIYVDASGFLKRG